ncbi:hypothetical protein [Oceanibaculum nanhaiense]|uniref:hypothetical protein n=1 Tax=Oceanibaculum nanhaiense TaxID=1909734 RepID=UPI00396D317A
MTIRTLMNKTALPALLVAGFVGLGAAGASATTVTAWGASDGNPTFLNQVTETQRTQAATATRIGTGISGSAAGASDADPTAGNRNRSVNVGSNTGTSTGTMPQLSQSNTGSAEVGIY